MCIGFGFNRLVLVLSESIEDEYGYNLYIVLNEKRHQHRNNLIKTIYQ